MNFGVARVQPSALEARAVISKVGPPPPSPNAQKGRDLLVSPPNGTSARGGRSRLCAMSGSRAARSKNHGADTTWPHELCRGRGCLVPISCWIAVSCPELT
jgi:hypothetical protein